MILDKIKGEYIFFDAEPKCDEPQQTKNCALARTKYLKNDKGLLFIDEYNGCKRVTLCGCCKENCG